MKKLFSLFLLCFITISTSADVLIDGITYITDDNTMRAAVSKGPSSGDVVIPESITVKGKVYSVYGTMDGVFMRSNITSVSIPSSMVVISNKTFAYCRQLKEVKIDLQNSKLQGVGTEAFYDCGSLTAINLPNSVSVIGTRAYENCTKVTSLHFPNNSEVIMGDEAFAYLESLKELVIPDNVQQIGYQGMSDYFLGCYSLEKVVIGKGVKVIYPAAFRDCRNLCEFITYEDGSLEAIGAQVFDGCSKITSMRFLPHTLKTLIGSAFSGCYLTEVYIPSSVEEYGNDDYVQNYLKTLYIEDSEVPLDVKSSCQSIYPEIYLGRPVNYSAPYYTSSLRNKRGGYSNIIEKVTFGPHFKGGRTLLFGFGVKEVYSYALEPWEINCYFEDDVYMNATLYVPQGMLEIYRYCDSFMYFANIVEMSANDIEMQKHRTAGDVLHSYGLDGRKQRQGQLGISIERMADRTVRKLIKKR